MEVSPEFLEERDAARACGKIIATNGKGSGGLII
jgi:hypothetical protein